MTEYRCTDTWNILFTVTVYFTLTYTVPTHGSLRTYTLGRTLVTVTECFLHFCVQSYPALNTEMEKA